MACAQSPEDAVGREAGKKRGEEMEGAAAASYRW